MRAIVLAAGEGRRFGGAKQAASLDGRPLLGHALALAADLRPIVVLGARADEVEERVDLSGATVVRCDAWASGQAASLRAGLGALDADEDGARVLLADQPRLTRAVVDGTLSRRDDGRWDAVRPTFAGAPGHPVLLTRAVIDRAAELAGGDGGRALLRRMRVRTWAADGLADPRDVDTPADLAALAAPGAGRPARPASLAHGPGSRS
jgi:CTP:molybdopterin cytidylyltransferase MocA